MRPPLLRTHSRSNEMEDYLEGSDRGSPGHTVLVTFFKPRGASGL